MTDTSVILGLFGAFRAGRARRKSAMPCSKNWTLESGAQMARKSVTSFSSAKTLASGAMEEESILRFVNFYSRSLKLSFVVDRESIICWTSDMC